MQTEYKARLKNGQVEWKGEPPPSYLNGATLLVTVVAADEARALSKSERGRRMKEALEEMSRLNTFSSITDPVAWQREIREDRELPGRD